MPKISIKGIQMPESPIRKLVPYAEQAKTKGTLVYHLNIGQPDINTPQIALDAVKNNCLDVVGVQPLRRLRTIPRKISGLLQKTQHSS
jgi:aspartate aminotransferase